MTNLILGLVVIAYPFLVYYGLNNLGVPLLALGLVFLFVGRTLLVAAGLNVSRDTLPEAPRNQFGVTKPLLVVALLVSVFGLLCWWYPSEQLFLFYPLVINLGFALVFASSLISGVSMIERLARLREPDLPAEATGYTRTVTKVWSFFFVSTALSRA